MIIKNTLMNCFDSVRDKIVDGEHLTLTISHCLEDGKFTGWFASITTHDPETDETDWGFCSGWHSTYHEAVASLKANPAYYKYTYPII